MAERKENMSMKVMVIVFIGVAFVAGYLFSRAKYKPQIVELGSMVMDRDETINTLNSLRNRYMLTDEGMVYLQDGEVTSVEEAVTLTDGSRINSDGSVIRSDGDEEQLGKGDSMLLDGTIFTRSEVMEMQGKN